MHLYLMQAHLCSEINNPLCIRSHGDKKDRSCSTSLSNQFCNQHIAGRHGRHKHVDCKCNTKNERSISQLVDAGITGMAFFEYLIIHQTLPPYRIFKGKKKREMARCMGGYAYVFTLTVPDYYLFILSTSTWPLCSQSFSSSCVGLASCLPAK